MSSSGRSSNRGRGKGAPGYLRHKDKKRGDRAFVLLDGKRVYLGRYGTPESKAKYERVIAEFLANGRQALPGPEEDSGPLVIEVVAAYWTHAKTYYRRADGTPTGEAERNVRYALRPLRTLYGDTPAREFGPSGLEAVRTHMVSEGLSRKVVNQRVGIIRRMFRWAESKELVPSGTFHNLTTLEPLKTGRSAAHETDDVMPVEWQHVIATLGHLSDHVAAMVQLQWETAMRPGEVVMMSAMDIDRSDPDVWFYRPVQHKNRHRGKARTVRLFARSQAILVPFLTDVEGDQNPSPFLFVPDGHMAKRDHYTTTTYAQAIRRAIAAANADGRHTAILEAVLPLAADEAGRRVEKAVRRMTSHLTTKRLETALRALADKLDLDADAFSHAGLSALANHQDAVPLWSPNQLRHAAATRIARMTDEETARHALDHSSLRTTRIYVDPDDQEITDKLRKLG